MKVAITGSSGLIGTALTASLQADGHQVVRLVRRPPRAADEVRWDPRAADAGGPVADRRRRLRAPGGRRGRRPPLDRRLQGGDPVQPGARRPGRSPPPWRRRRRGRRRSSSPPRSAGTAIPAAPRSPRTRPRARRSSPGWWPTGRPPPPPPARPASASRTCAAASSSAPGGGVLGRLALPARLGVLPRFGDGRQVMSWISLTDEVRAIRFLLDGRAAPARAAAVPTTSPRPTRSPTPS